jgi:nucleoside-diphosphate-sugar epimerase
MNEKPMCVAITGAGGFLGQPTLAALAESNATIVAASRSIGKGKSVSQNIFSATVDITKPSSWDSLFAGNRPTRLIHLAWDHLDDFEDPRHYLEQLPHHLAFIEWCVAKGISDVTVAGTCYEYGLVNGQLHEEMPASPVIAYAIAKDALRRSLTHLSGIAKFTLKWARIFYVRGDEQAEKGVFKCLRDAAKSGKNECAVSWGEQLRDYLPRKNVGQFLAHFCLQNDIVGIVNCCSGKPMSMRRMVEAYAERWPDLRLDFGKVAYRACEPMAFWGCTKRMEQVLGSSI